MEKIDSTSASMTVRDKYCTVVERCHELTWRLVVPARDDASVTLQYEVELRGTHGVVGWDSDEVNSAGPFDSLCSDCCLL